jgi:hypothetical protein
MGAEEGVLEGFLRVRPVAGEPAGQRVDAALVAGDERLEGPRLAGARAPDQRRVVGLRGG